MDPDLVDLIAALKGEDPGADRLDELLARLRRDDAFRDALAEELRLLGMLKAVQSTEPRWLRLHDELGWGAGEGDEAGREDAFMRRLASERRPSPAGRRRRLAASLVAAAVVLAAGLWGARRDPAPPPRPAAPPVEYDDALAVVVRLDGVVWGPGDGPRPREGDLVAAGRLRLASGRATLSMLSGVVLVAEGPADFDLVAPDRIFCRLGRLRSRVPQGAEGLVITSPTAAVLDLGTEFGLNVDAAGRSRVKVFQGRVEAVARAAGGDQYASRLLDARGSVQIGPGPGEIRPAPGADDFAGPVNLPAPALALDPAYPSAVAASRPRAYWRFERLDVGVVPNEVAGGEPLRAVGPIRLSEPAFGNRSAVLPAGQPLQYLAMDGEWRPAPGPEYAVELWFLTEAVDHSCLLAFAAPAGTNLHALVLETSSRNRHALHPPGSVRFLDRWPPGKWDGYNLYSRAPYIPARWHHLVAQLRDGRMELYLDGRPTRSAGPGVRHETRSGQVILGRLSTIEGDGDANPENDYIFRRALAGRLDEVALYDHGLDPEEVRRHHALGGTRPPR